MSPGKISLAQCAKQYKTEDKNPKEKPEMVVMASTPAFERET